VEKFISRKFIMTVVVVLLVSVLPITYKTNEVGDTITMTVLAILAAVGAAYGFINVKDAKLEIQKKAKELVSGGSEDQAQ